MLPFVDFIPNKTWETWLSLISLGLVCNWLAYLCFCAGLKYLPATRVSVFETASEPFLAALFAFIWWGENFTLSGWLGAVLVVGAVVIIISIKDKNREFKSPKINSYKILTEIQNVNYKLRS